MNLQYIYIYMYVHTIFQLSVTGLPAKAHIVHLTKYEHYTIGRRSCPNTYKNIYTRTIVYVYIYIHIHTTSQPALQH